MKKRKLHIVAMRNTRNCCYKHIGHLDEGLRNTINSLGELQRNYLLSDYEITVKEDYEAFKGILDELDQLTVIIEAMIFHIVS